MTRAYAEYEEHYGFLIDPCLPKRPEHKGKVERGGVGYVQQSFMPLLNTIQSFKLGFTFSRG